VLGLLVVSHGRLAVDLVEAASTIVGPLEAVEAVCLDWTGLVAAAELLLRAAPRRVDRGQGLLLLTDMFGGTPTNLALSLLEPRRIEIVTGVNLPMLIKFANLRQELSLAEAAAAIAEQGRASIQVATRLLGKP
jgi:PTS system mannose-specific IIA component